MACRSKVYPFLKKNIQSISNNGKIDYIGNPSSIEKKNLIDNNEL